MSDLSTTEEDASNPKAIVEEDDIRQCPGNERAHVVTSLVACGGGTHGRQLLDPRT